MEWRFFLQVKEHSGLNDMTRAILDKYKDIPFKDNKALSLLANQKMDDYIKELCKMAEIDTQVRIIYYKGNERVDELYPKHQLIGTHAGRRTFICTALSLNIPPGVIMKWTGHSSHKSGSLVDKFDGANAIIANYLVHKSLEFDNCIVMDSCDIVLGQLKLIERSISALANSKEHLTFLRSLATEVERLLAKIEPNIETLSHTEVAMIFDVTPMTSMPFSTFLTAAGGLKSERLKRTTSITS